MKSLANRSHADAIQKAGSNLGETKRNRIFGFLLPFSFTKSNPVSQGPEKNALSSVLHGSPFPNQLYPQTATPYFNNVREEPH